MLEFYIFVFIHAVALCESFLVQRRTQTVAAAARDGQTCILLHGEKNCCFRVVARKVRECDSVRMQKVRAKAAIEAGGVRGR